MKELHALDVKDFNGMPYARTTSKKHIIHNLKVAEGESQASKYLELANDSNKNDVIISVCCQFAYFIYFNAGEPIHMEMISFKKDNHNIIDKYLDNNIHLKTESHKNKFRDAVEVALKGQSCEATFLQTLP